MSGALERLSPTEQRATAPDPRLPPWPEETGSDVEAEMRRDESDFTAKTERGRRLSKMQKTGTLPENVDERGLSVGDLCEPSPKKRGQC